MSRVPIVKGKFSLIQAWGVGEFLSSRVLIVKMVASLIQTWWGEQDRS